MQIRMSVALVTLIVGSSSVVRAEGHPVIQLRGVGTQVYACAPAPTGYAWKFKAPDASLTNMGGVVEGHHFAGPSWQATDGSMVVGEVLVSAPAPEPTSIPWLLLRAKSHRGSGSFASVGYIARTQTEGGMPPASGCDARHAGLETKVSYRAIYTLFPAAGAQ